MNTLYNIWLQMTKNVQECVEDQMVQLQSKEVLYTELSSLSSLFNCLFYINGFMVYQSA